jgi:hypothetical protein
MEKLGPENLGKDWAEGRTRKMEDLERLERLEMTKKEGRSASPMRPESELHSMFNSISARLQLSACGAPSGKIQYRYRLYYNRLPILQ